MTHHGHYKSHHSPRSPSSQQAFSELSHSEYTEGTTSSGIGEDYNYCDSSQYGASCTAGSPVTSDILLEASKNPSFPKMKVMLQNPLGAFCVLLNVTGKGKMVYFIFCRWWKPSETTQHADSKICPLDPRLLTGMKTSRSSSTTSRGSRCRQTTTYPGTELISLEGPLKVPPICKMAEGLSQRGLKGRATAALPCWCSTAWTGDQLPWWQPRPPWRCLSIPPCLERHTKATCRKDLTRTVSWTALSPLNGLAVTRENNFPHLRKTLWSSRTWKEQRFRQNISNKDARWAPGCWSASLIQTESDWQMSNACSFSSFSLQVGWGSRQPKIARLSRRSPPSLSECPAASLSTLTPPRGVGSCPGPPDCT